MRYTTIFSSLVFCIIIVLTSFPVISSEVAKDLRPQHISNALDKARYNLENASNSFRNGDIETTRSNLETAAKWLDKAAQNNETAKAREESKKLSNEINVFRDKLTQSSDIDENSLVRFWHQSTSIIKRETDHLIHSYTELSVSEKTLKYLLNAKMHLFIAEHDLFVSQLQADATRELDLVLTCLADASQAARPSIAIKIDLLRKDITLLQKNVDSTRDAWKDDQVILSLNDAMVDLKAAKSNASPGIIPRIELIEDEITALRIDHEKVNLKNSYESTMAAIKNIIHEL